MQGFALPDNEEAIIVNEIENDLEIIFITRRTLEISDVASSELVGVHVFTRLSMSLPVAVYLNMLLYAQILGNMPVVSETMRTTRSISIQFSKDHKMVTVVFMRPMHNADFDEAGIFRKATIRFTNDTEKLVVHLVITKETAKLFCEAFLGTHLKDIVLNALNVRDTPLQS